MTTLRKTLFAFGFMSLGALGTLGLSAVAGPDYDGERAERFSGPDSARGGPHGGPHGGPDHGLRALDFALGRLDLTEEQEAVLDSARDDIRDRVAEGREQALDERQELAQALRDGTLERDDVKARISTRMAEAQETVLFAVDRIFDVYETLDDEQRAELGEMVAAHAERRSRRGPRGE